MSNIEANTETTATLELTKDEVHTLLSLARRERLLTEKRLRELPLTAGSVPLRAVLDARFLRLDELACALDAARAAMDTARLTRQLDALEERLNAFARERTERDEFARIHGC